MFVNLLMLDFDRGWAVSSFGRIIHTSNSPSDIGENDLNTSKDLNYKLYQNYPNPFNPVAKIKYELHEWGVIKIEVYDMLGKEVVTLVNEEKSAGNYEVEFDASKYNLSSGIYIYALRVNKKFQVKKMIYLK